jgi:hypothetical protein
MPPHPTYWKSGLMLSFCLCRCLPNGLFPLGFPAKILFWKPVRNIMVLTVTKLRVSQFYPSLNFCSVSCSAYIISSWFYHLNNIWWGVQIVKVLVIWTPLLPCP